MEKKSSSSSSSSSPMGGVQDFEKWWSNDAIIKKNNDNNKRVIRHATFHNESLRGLEIVPSSSSSPKTTTTITVPRRVVLQTPFIENEWDVKLSLMLLREYQKGLSSDLYGYTSLLSRGLSSSPDETTTTPPPTAPDALRHWTTSQKSILSSHPSGRRLLEREEKQRLRWETQYDTMVVGGSSDDVPFSREMFFWAMEAVHSRAFCGSFGLYSSSSSSSSLVATTVVGVQIIAAVVGYQAVASAGGGGFGDLDGGRLVGAVGLVLLPLLFTAWNESSSQQRGESSSAVLLPFIDSANHKRDANSDISFDPLKEEFVLTIDDDTCVVTEDDDDEGKKKKQLYISYGTKGDDELMINYGFLEGLDDDGGGSSDDERRRRMAEEYLKRHS